MVERATNYQIVSDEVYNEAGKVISWISQAKKKVEERRKFFTQPLNNQIKKINELFKTYSIPFEQSDKIMRDKMLIYRQEQEKKRLIEEQKMRKEAEKIAKKEKVPVSEVVASMETKETVLATDKTTVKKIWTFEIIDENKIPREYLVADETKIRKAIIGGMRKIDGIKIFEKEIISIK